MTLPLVASEPLRASAADSTLHPFGCENVASLVLRHAQTAPHRLAFIATDQMGGVVSYGELAVRVAAFAHDLERAGVGAGDRVLLLLPMSVDLYALALAILASGAAVTLVDGRLAPRRLLAAISDAEAHTIVAPAALMRWWPLVRATWRMRRCTLDGWALGSSRLRGRGARSAPTVTDVRADHPALISFTSGSTGRAKAIVRTHGVLTAQHRALAAAFPSAADDVNLPGFPVAALHNLCCGSTTVLPSTRDARPHNVAQRAEAMLTLVRLHGVTSLSASPAVLDALAAAVLRSRDPVPTLRRIVVGGGPVSRRLCDRVLRAFPDAEATVIYGATEAEPIATVSMAEVLTAAGTGFLVGRGVPSVEVALRGGDGRATGDIEPGIGEVTVRGAHVIQAATASGRDAGWHRTGDVGAFDARGRLWLLGRIGFSVTHRGRELHPYIVEAEALAIDGVRAAALVRHAHAPDGELVISLSADADGCLVQKSIKERLEALDCSTLPVRVCAEIPMDARHASKVAREELVRRLSGVGR